MTVTKTLGKYQIESLLGKGAFAEVYRAMDTSLKRTVALKVLKPALLADEEAFARFVQEAQILANLVHPYIAWVWDLGEADGRYFIAMRYVDGKSLDKVIAVRGALPWDEVLKITEDVAGALAFAHAKGFVHRDIKPQNIIISESEGAVLTDFGLVKVLHSSGMSSMTSLIGTPSYIAPEIWEGESSSPASDQYALACVVVEMLTGRVLFGGATPAIMKNHLLEAPALPEKLPAGAPAGVVPALQRALGKKAEGRYGGMMEFVAALKEIGAVPVPAQVRQGRLAPEYAPVRVEGNQMVLTLVPSVEMVFMCVPASEFLMGSDIGNTDEKPQHTVYLDEYWMGKYPVTNSQYQAFLENTRHTPPSHWKSDRVKRGAGKNHPVVNVSWLDAQAFCTWASQATGHTIRLAGEAEWEKVARGTNGRTYPWGDQKPDKTRCNFANPLFLGGGTTPAGRFSPAGDSPYGCVDMAGNVWEWVNDWYDSTYYRQSPHSSPPGPATGSYRVLRGGSWANYESSTRSAGRYRLTPARASGSVGFRCSCSH